MIRTAQQLKGQSRRLDRLNAKVAEVLASMRAGSALHFAYGTWRLSSGRHVGVEVARLVINHHQVVGVGDALPIVGEGLCQSWRYIDDETE